MRKLRRWFSTKAYKHVKIYLIGFIALFNILLVCLAGIIIHLISPDAYVTVGSGIWQILTDVLDPGFLANSAANGGTNVTRTIEIVVIMVAMVTFTGAIIGYISSFITGIIDNSVTGPKNMYLKDHILILNWNNRAAGIISEYLYTEICEDVVVLATNDRNSVVKEIEDSILELGYTKKQKHVNFTVKQGEPFSYTELEAVCAKQARTIIVLSDHSSSEGDLRTLKTVMMVSQMNQNRKDCAIVVETDSQNIYELVSRMQDNEVNNIIPAYLNKLLGKLLAHIALQPELNTVFAELLSHNGNEFYSIPFDELKGIDPEAPEDDMIARYLEIYNHGIPLITTKSFSKDPRGKMFVMSEQKSDITKLRERLKKYKDEAFGDKNKSEENEVTPCVIKKDYPIPRKVIVLLGSNSKMKYMTTSFEAFIANYGADKLKVYFIDTKEHLERVPHNESFECIEIADRYNILEIRNVLHKFNMEEISTIVILSDDTVSSVEYDSGALISLIDINKELEKVPKERRPEVIVEILNPKNHEIVQQYNIDNVVVSNKYISSMMAQLGDDDSIYEMIYDILTFDGEIDDFSQTYSANAKSRELYVKRCGDYFEKLPRFKSYGDMVRSVYQATNGETRVLGIVHADDALNYRVGSKDKTYTLPDDLDKPVDLKLKADDKLIVFSHVW